MIFWLENFQQFGRQCLDCRTPEHVNRFRLRLKTTKLRNNAVNINCWLAWHLCILWADSQSSFIKQSLSGLCRRAEHRSSAWRMLWYVWQLSDI